MIGAAVLILLATAGGSVASYRFDREAPGYARIATGVFVGLTALAFGAFAMAWLTGGLGTTSLVLGLLVAMLPLLALRSAALRAMVVADLAASRDRLAGGFRAPTRAGLLTLLYVALLAGGVWLVADRTFFATAEGLSIGNVNNLGDLPYHVQITASFAYGDNFPPQNPVFAGSGFSYHYIADFLAAVFVAAGADLVGGVFLVSLVLGAALLPLVHRWAAELTGSAIAARLTPLLLVLSGGLGWLTLFSEARAGEHGLIAAFFESDARYTIANEGFLRFGNAVTTLLSPQRGLLLGMGLAIIVLTLLWRQLDEPGPGTAGRPSPRAWLGRIASEPRMLVAGILTGLLPIIHVHTFAVVFGTAFFLGLLFRQWRDGRWQDWAVYVVATAVVAAPVALVTASGSQANVGSFVGLELGWDRGDHDPVTFWLYNTGLFIPLLIAAFAWRGRRPILSTKLLLYALPFLAWFLLPNVVRLAPWLWDNIKVFIYWWLGGAPLVALVLARLWQERRLAIRGAAVAMAVVLMAAGALDIARATVGQTYQEFDRDGIAFAEQVRERTPPNAVVAAAPVWYTPIMLTGRPLALGFTGYLFANGLPYAEREADVRAIYAGEAAAESLIERYRIDYVAIGPPELGEFSGVVPNEAFFARYPIAVEVGPYRLYDVRIAR